MASRVDHARAETPGAAKSPNARGELTERSRDRILAAALSEFANRGFDGTTTAEIARRAGVTQPLVHYHFDSKDALWYATVEEAFRTAAVSFADVGSEMCIRDRPYPVRCTISEISGFYRSIRTGVQGVTPTSEELRR